MPPTMPEGAQVSDDGNYWWDESAGQWQLVSDSTGDDADGGDVSLDFEYDVEDYVELSLDDLIGSGWEPESDGTEDVA